MTISVVPTLEVMADVYRRSLSGGATSERFAAYVDAAQLDSPIHGYNPMTSKPVGATVEALLDLEAETLLARVANATANGLGVDVDAEMYITVATPGMWTDRLATEVEHRILAHHPEAVLWWYDDPVEVVRFEAEAVAQAARLCSFVALGVPDTLQAAVVQEGRALARAGNLGRFDPVAADALDVLADDTALSTKVAYLYGDEAAGAMGYRPLGLDDRVGYAHAVHLARCAADPVS